MPIVTEERPNITIVLEAVEQLTTPELNQVEKRLKKVKSQRRAALALTFEEKRRLSEIVREIPDETRHRYQTLVEKLHDETLTDTEQEELERLSDQIEGVEVKRLEYLAELARQRNVSLVTLMDTLGIKSPSYV